VDDDTEEEKGARKQGGRYNFSKGHSLLNSQCKLIIELIFEKYFTVRACASRAKTNVGKTNVGILNRPLATLFNV